MSVWRYQLLSLIESVSLCLAKFIIRTSFFSLKRHVLEHCASASRLGFSLLFYGYGSKKAILDSFGLQACKDGGVLSVNGWGHMLSLRSLLLKVVSMLRTSGIQSTRYCNFSEICSVEMRGDLHHKFKLPVCYKPSLQAESQS